jgi:hypothetical protein
VRRRLVAAGLGACAFAGCAGGGEEVHPRGNMTLEEARRFRVFPLYYPGGAVGDLKLEAIVRTRYSSPRPYTQITLLYGTCEARSDRGCASPLHVLVWPECFRFELRYSIPVEERVTVRGVPGRLRRAAAGESPRLELYPRNATVVLNDFSGGEVGPLLDVADRLVGLNVATAASADLPERPPRAARGARCRRT